MNHAQLCMWPEEERVASPAVIVVLVFVTAIGTLGMLHLLSTGRVELAVVALGLMGSLTRFEGRWKTSSVARLDAWFGANVAHLWLAKRTRWRHALRGQLRRIRRIARVSTTIMIVIVLAMLVAIVAGLRMPAQGAVAGGVLVFVVLHVATVSVACSYILGVLVRDWDRTAATPLRCGAVEPAAERAQRMHEDRAVNARHAADVIAVIVVAVAILL